MARVVVDVMLKPEILDPQGQAVANALPRLGVDEVASVRVGRRIELEFDGPPDLAKVNQLADRLLANPVIEDYTVTVDDEPTGRAAAPRAGGRRAAGRRAAPEPAEESRPETASPAETAPAPPPVRATEPPVAPAEAEPVPDPDAADGAPSDDAADGASADRDAGDPVAADRTAGDAAGGEQAP